MPTAQPSTSGKGVALGIYSLVDERADHSLGDVEMVYRNVIGELL